MGVVAVELGWGDCIITSFTGELVPDGAVEVLETLRRTQLNEIDQNA